MSIKAEANGILEALHQVEHPAIAASLAELGMLQNPRVTEEGNVSLTLVLPFPNIPDNVKNLMITSLAAAAQRAGGELTTVNLSFMNKDQRQVFLNKEQQNWRG